MIDYYRTKENEIVISYGEHGFKRVLDSIQDTTHIYIVTFNLNTYNGWRNCLHFPESCDVTLVTNIPQRKKKDNGTEQLNSDNIQKYIDYLRPVALRAQYHVYINYSNHAKVLMTDSIAYIGSENFSNRSKDNYEFGILIQDEDDLNYIKTKIDEMIKNSIPMLITHHERQFLEYADTINKLTIIDYVIQCLLTDRHNYDTIAEEEIDLLYKATNASESDDLLETMTVFCNLIDEQLNRIFHLVSDYMRMDVHLSLENQQFEFGKIDCVSDELSSFWGKDTPLRKYYEYDVESRKLDLFVEDGTDEPFPGDPDSFMLENGMTIGETIEQELDDLREKALSSCNGLSELTRKIIKKGTEIITILQAKEKEMAQTNPAIYQM